MRGYRLLIALAGASIAAGGCGRSHIGLDESAAPDGDWNPFDVRAGSGGSGATPGGTAGVGPISGAPNPGTPPMAMQPPPPTMWGSGGSGGSFAPSPPPGTAGTPPPPTGVAGAGVPIDPNRPGGIDVLNPQRCASEEPFVLSIDPGGASGFVKGWLESAPSVIFDEFGLPRFGQQEGPGGDPGGELGVWWSIASLSEPGSLWFYPAGASTEVAHVFAQRFSEIVDARNLMYVSDVVGQVFVGEIAVFHHIPTDRYLAVKVVDLYGTEDSDRRDLCAAIEARWAFAGPGGDFSRTR